METATLAPIRKKSHGITAPGGFLLIYPFILQFLISPVGAIPSTDRIFIPFCHLLHSQPTCFFHFLPEK